MTRASSFGLVLGVVAALGGSALGGCGGSSTGEAGAYLVSGLEDRTDLYLVPGVDTRPLTLAQIGEENAELAIAVDVEVYEDIAVAFRRTELGLVDYSRANIVGLWRVLGRNITNVEAVDEELENGPDGPVYVPGGRSFGRVNPEGLRGDGVTDSPEFDLVDFTDLVDTSVFEDAALWNHLNTAHPGCA